MKRICLPAASSPGSIPKLVVQAVQRKTPGRAVVEGRVENTYVAEGDVAAHHPSSGTGNFVSAFQPQFHSAAGNGPEIVAYEKDLLTGR